ncbi:hypothetical protein OIU76_001730 [Salix suchowensis]|nr:hypothetical protein OIU76_001730 [Salix suchowensis]
MKTSTLFHDHIIRHRSQTIRFHDTLCSAFLWGDRKKREREMENRTSRHDYNLSHIYFHAYCSWHSHTIPSIAELALDPLETVPNIGFKLSFHGKNIIRCNSLPSF